MRAGDMTTIRVAARIKFTQIERDTVNDSRLSFKARGVLIWLLDKPDDWRSNSEAIAHNSIDGRDAVRSALTELETLGYLKREKSQDDKGQWMTIVTVYESPTKAQVAPETDYPASVNRSSVNRSSGFPAPSIHTDTNTDNTKGYPQPSYKMVNSNHQCEECEAGWVTDNRGVAIRRCLNIDSTANSNSAVEDIDVCSEITSAKRKLRPA